MFPQRRKWGTKGTWWRQVNNHCMQYKDISDGKFGIGRELETLEREI